MITQKVNTMDNAGVASSTTGVAPLRNVAALSTQIDLLATRESGLPGIGVFSGPSGFGKSFAATFAMLEYDAVYLQLRSTWTTKEFMMNLLEELEIKNPKGTISALQDQVIDRLIVDQRPVIIDEADYLINKRNIEAVRDIYESTHVPVILVGEEMLPQKIKQFERMDGRILSWVQALPVDFTDATHLASMYAPNVTVQDDLLNKVLDAANGSARRVATNLANINRYARRHALQQIDAATWGDKELFTGAAPVGRSFTRLKKGA
ncbi:AAA family ATPase [Marivivens aquimaris]|uniref:AAA family ATPase n=1 Tax=Marivivens aquimaris TaxID=2774876 RepID=UPI00187E56AF|nr:ATP-binding protein [Marivivens aquimaris]